MPLATCISFSHEGIPCRCCPIWRSQPELPAHSFLLILSGDSSVVHVSASLTHPKRAWVAKPWTWNSTSRRLPCMHVRRRGSEGQLTAALPMLRPGTEARLLTQFYTSRAHLAYLFRSSLPYWHLGEYTCPVLELGLDLQLIPALCLQLTGSSGYLYQHAGEVCEWADGKPSCVRESGGKPEHSQVPLHHLSNCRG